MNMTSPDNMQSDTYAAQKARYDELYKRGREARRDFAEAPGNPAVIASRPRGQTLRLTAAAGCEGVSVLLYRAAEVTERLNVGDTVKLQWSATLQRGKLLYSDMGRVLASMTDDTYGHHDALAGGSTAASNIAKYGDDGLRHTRGNFILLAGKHGISKVDIPPCVTFFAPVTVDAEGKFAWTPPAAVDGDYVDLRAEMDLLVFVSNCPHPLSPGAYAPPPVDLMRWQSPEATSSDFCRTSCEEARRGFDNTDALTGFVVEG